MEQSVIDAEKIGIRQLFSNFWFKIPSYQRSYVWDDDNVLALLDDLKFAFNNSFEKEYFVGSLVLQALKDSDYKEYEVLDGQQRITTFFLLHAVIRDVTGNEQLQKTAQSRIFQEKNDFDNIPERVRIVFDIRDDVESFVSEYIVAPGGTQRFDDLMSEVDVKNISISNMARVLIKISDFLKQLDNLDDFAKFISNKIVFIYVATADRDDAYRLFTVLNNRGVPLTNSDILKTINIGSVASSKQDKYAKKWEEIESEFGQDFDRFLSFLRTILVKEKARVNLLKEYQDNIYQKNLLKQGEETIDYICRFADHYDQVINLSERQLSNKFKNFVVVMLIALPSQDWIPPLLRYKDKFGLNFLDEFLEKLESKFVGDWISQLDPTQRIENMNHIVHLIDTQADCQKIINSPAFFAIDKESVKRVLSGNVYGKKFAKYILLKYELLLNDHSVFVSHYNSVSVEHVLPQNPDSSSDWLQSFTEEERISWTNKLANLVLINRRKNSSLSNLSFKDKKKKYFDGKMDVFVASKVFLSSKDVWDISVLQERENSMLNLLID